MKNILIIDDDLKNIEEIKGLLSPLVLNIFEAYDFDSAFDCLNEFDIELVISSYYLSKNGNGLSFYEELVHGNNELPFWLFYSSIKDSTNTKNACSLGALDVLAKPFSLVEFKRVFERIQNRLDSPLSEILDTVEAITGVQLGKEKKLLVETRLLRRMRQLEIDTHLQYLQFFKQNRMSEIDELVSLLTTHTTEFFREKEHFKFLESDVFPKILQKKTFRFLSAASSTSFGCPLISHKFKNF